MRKLSECKRPKRYAYCAGCKEFFIDDDTRTGNIGCPNGCYYVLERGLTKYSTKVKTYTDEQKTITHANINCLDCRFCLPHGEEGIVNYDIKSMVAHIKYLEKEIEDYNNDLLDKKD